jgi:hypothetical protein
MNVDILNGDSDRNSQSYIPRIHPNQMVCSTCGHSDDRRHTAHKDKEIRSPRIVCKECGCEVEPED